MVEATRRVKVHPKYTRQVQLDRERSFYYGMGAYEAFQRHTKKPLDEWFSEVRQLTLDKNDAALSLRFPELLTFLWAGLVVDDPQLSVEDIGLLIDYAPGETMQERMMGCVHVAFSALIAQVSDVKKKLELEEEIERAMSKAKEMAEARAGNGTSIPSGDTPALTSASTLGTSTG